ncbi:hypothetical protein [Kitasatospora sp. NPDC001132]
MSRRSCVRRTVMVAAALTAVALLPPTTAQAASGTVTAHDAFCQNSDVKGPCILVGQPWIVTDPPSGCYHVQTSDQLSGWFVENRLNTAVRIHAGANCTTAAVDSLPRNTDGYYPRDRYRDGISIYVP